MGAWGTAIFSDDTAADVRDEFKDLITDGVEAVEATRRLVAEWADTLADPDEAPVFWLALAATQVKLGRLQEDVKNRALEVIDSGVDLRRWQEDSEASPGDVARRRAHLEKLRIELTAPQKPPTKVRRANTYVEVTDWLIGEHWGYRLASGRWVVLRVVAIDVRTPCNEARFTSGSDWWPGTLPVVEVLDEGWHEPPSLEQAESARPRQGCRQEDFNEPVHALIVARATRRDFPADRLGLLGCVEVGGRPKGLAARMRRNRSERRTELVLWKWLDNVLAERWSIS